MTEKRYYVNSACYLCDTDLSNTLSIFECADLLNKLVDENEILIQNILIKEEIINDLKDDINKCNIQCRKLGNENEQLKQFIKELATKGTGRIELPSGYSYNVSAVLTGYRGDVE